MPFVLSAATSLILVAAPYCPARHAQAECDVAWEAAQAEAATRHRIADRQVDTDALAARNEVTKNLADPESARFRNVRAFRLAAGANILFCGEINAKNQMGAYTGYRPFVAGAAVGVIAGVGSDPAISDVRSAMVHQACTAAPFQSYGAVTF